MLRLVMLTVMGVLFAAQAYAAEADFNDQIIFWPGYPESEDAFPDPSGHNDQDFFGTPNITGGQVVTRDNALASITFDVVITRGEDWSEATWRSVWGNIFPGDLFLDTDSNGAWDYVVVMNPNKTDWTPLTDETYEGPASFGLQRAEGLYPMFRFSAPLQEPFQGGYPYIETIKPQSFFPRFDHPVWADRTSPYLGQQVGQVSFSGWPTFPEGYDFEELPVTYDFTTESLEGLNISAEDLTIGYTISSASDVILVRVNVTDEGGSSGQMPVCVPNMLLLHQ